MRLIRRAIVGLPCVIVTLACGSSDSTPTANDDGGATAPSDGGGGAPIDAGAQSDGGATANGKRLFITSHTLTGDLAANGKAATGVLSGDAICQQAASAANAGGTWRAWLSDTQTDAIARIQGGGPWTNMPRTKVLFADRAALASGPATLGSDLTDETGATFPDRLAWTGTKSDGTRDAANCKDWTSGAQSDMGIAGETAAPKTWTDQRTVACYALTLGLYCFEQ